MDPETLELARIVRMERQEEPLNVPEQIEVAVLQESVRIIDVYLDHYRDGKDGSDFRYVKKSETNYLNKLKSDRQRIVREAAEQLEWILSDDPATGEGLTFRHICDAQGIQDIPGFRNTLLSCTFANIHRNALETLYEYNERKREADEANEYQYC